MVYRLNSRGILRHCESVQPGRPDALIPRWREVLADFGPRYAANGFIGWFFAATAPVADLGLLNIDAAFWGLHEQVLFWS